MIRSYQRSVARLKAEIGQPRRLAPATRKRRLVSLRSFLRFAAREEWLRGDLGGTIDLPKLAERLPKPLEDAARTKLHRALGGTTVEAKRDRALILLLLSSGARISEVLRLDRDDWAMDRVTVRGKGDRERVLMITDKARDAVDDYLAARDDPSPALFISFQPKVRGKRENRLSDDGARHICPGSLVCLGSRHSTRTSSGTRSGRCCRRLSAMHASPRRRLATSASHRWPATRRSRKDAGGWPRTRCNVAGCNLLHPRAPCRPATGDPATHTAVALTGPARMSSPDAFIAHRVRGRCRVIS